MGVLIHSFIKHIFGINHMLPDTLLGHVMLEIEIVYVIQLFSI